jgi:preprotein translocase subunit SecE
MILQLGGSALVIIELYLVLWSKREEAAIVTAIVALIADI